MPGKSTLEMKELGLLKHIFCYITLGLLCGWYFVLLITVPLLTYFAYLGSRFSQLMLTILTILTYMPISHKPNVAFMVTSDFPANVIQ